MLGNPSGFPNIQSLTPGHFFSRRWDQISQAPNAIGTTIQLSARTERSIFTHRSRRKKASRLRVAVYTFPGTIDDLAAFYAGKVPGVSFLFTEREIGKDLAETALAGGFALAPSLAKEWQGKKGRSARWARSDGSLEIDIEDHLIDPRDGRVTRQGVVMVTGTN